MTQDEIYFQDPSPNLNIDVTPQNDMKALMSIKRKFNCLIMSQDLSDKQAHIVDLHLKHTRQLCNQFVARSAATPTRVLSDNTCPKIERFIKWAHQNGTIISQTLASLFSLS